MPITAPPRRKYAVSNIDGAACAARWTVLERAINDAFTGARFMPGFDATSPVTHTSQGLGPAYLHVLAEAGDRVLGAAFRIPIECPAGGTDADPGWFFIARDLPAALKVDVADGLIEHIHGMMRVAGFTRVVTNMGTRAGASFLHGRHGYLHVPIDGQENRWVCQL